jgi:hypothetical protein
MESFNLSYFFLTAFRPVGMFPQNLHNFPIHYIAGCKNLFYYQTFSSCTNFDPFYMCKPYFSCMNVVNTQYLFSCHAVFGYI